MNPFFLEILEKNQRVNPMIFGILELQNAHRRAESVQSVTFRKNVHLIAEIV